MFFSIFVALTILSDMRFKTIFSMLAISGTAFHSMADTPGPGVSLIEHVQADSVIEVIAPPGLEQRLKGVPADDNDSSHLNEGKATGSAVRAGGYRIQVFSDNNARSAKAEARGRARNISSRFPQYRTYVVYNAPFWRLRVGDFRNQQDAQQAADEIRRAFPSYSREVRVVRDRISVIK